VRSTFSMVRARGSLASVEAVGASVVMAKGSF